MSKAILVMDIPKSCGECSICASWQKSAFSAREYWCPVMDNKDVEPNKKPVWCPLKEVPKKKKDTLMTNYSRYVQGWNDCIDRILEGSEEDE